MIELTEEELKFIEKMERTQIPNKIESKMLQRIHDKITGLTSPNNCFCSSSSRNNFRNNFFKKYQEFKIKNKQ